MQYPPPSVSIDPSRLLKERVPVGTTLVRVYNPSAKYSPKPGPRIFRQWGPTARFDHHRGGAGPERVTPAARDPDRGIYYAAYDLEGAVVEVFGNEPRIITCGTWRVAYIKLSADLELLDLRGSGGMLAGPTTAISGTETRPLSQAWARYFYDRVDIYGPVDGLIYGNSHNYGDAIALFERAKPVIERSAIATTGLASPKLELDLLRIAEKNGLILEP